MVDRASTLNIEQPALFPPPVVEISLRIGIVSDVEHVQAQIEVRSGTDGQLLAMQAWPHFEMSATEDRMREIGRSLTAIVREHTGPFT